MNYPRMPIARPDERKRRKTKEEIDRQLDEGLKESFPTSDPVAITAPGGPDDPHEDSSKKKSSQE